MDLNRNPEVFARYDAISATLFKKLGVSDRMINDFLRSILLVGLFKPPEELSAAVTMELLYYYALAHQDAFDALDQGRQHRGALIAPLAQRLISTRPAGAGGTLATRLNLCPETGQVHRWERSVATGERGSG